MIKHAFTSAKGNGADATQVQPSNWNDDHVIDTGGAKIATSTTVPAAPAAGNVQLFGQTLAGASMIATVGPLGMVKQAQPFLGTRRVARWNSTGNTNSGPIQGDGLILPTYSGTPTTRNVANTNLFATTRRTGIVSATTAGSFARASNGTPQFLLGTAAGMGGFLAVFRWGCSDAATVSGARTFVGMAASSVGNVDPSTTQHMIGVGTDSGDTTLSIMTNDGVGTATKTALGANFPDHTLSVDAYELILFCPPNATSIGWQVTRLNTGDVASGTITTDIPGNTQLLFPQFMRNNNATALAVGIDLMHLYIETDN